MQMDFFNSALSSNAVQLILTFSLGASLSFLPLEKIILPVGAIISICIITSFIFVIGEVYIYSDTYRRAFFVFGDEITTVLGFILFFAIAAKRNVLTLLTLTAVFMSGGKASLVLIVLMLALFLFIQRGSGERQAEVRRLFRLSALAVIIYIVCQSLSLSLMNSQAFISIHERLTSGLEHISSTNRGSGFPRIGSACANLSKCVDTQMGNPLLQRYYTSLAGLWMTVRGGFPGKSYPGTPEKFADLMVASNPWGMNDRYNLDWKSWQWMGGVQSPYLAFGSGYGPLALLGLGIAFLAVAYLAWGNLIRGQADASAVFSIFFIVNVIVNWTQSWLMSGSIILITLGLCCSQILISAALSHPLPSTGSRLLQRFVVKPVGRPGAPDPAPRATS